MKYYMGPILIMFAAFLWGLDALIRTDLSSSMIPISIVLFEHIIGFIILTPFAKNAAKKLPKITSKDFAFLALLALVSSVGGTLLFTEALSRGFATGDFITPLLIQKLQPILVIIMAVIFLKELIPKKFFIWAPVALIGSYLMSFGAHMPSSLSGKAEIVLLALGAATCWGVGTILSKKVLSKFSVIESTWYRFALAIPITLVLAAVLGKEVGAPSGGEFVRLLVIALSTGTVALLIYYRGLKRTPAHIATFAELMFPLTSIVIGVTSLNPYGDAQKLSSDQAIGIVLLLLGVIQIARSINRSKNRVVGKVIKGSGDGAKIGFRTANVALATPLSLAYGVYASLVHIDGKKYGSVTHYGPRAVFGETHPQFEVHIFDFKKNIYGKAISVEVKDFIRGTVNFESMDELVKQIKKDCSSAKKLLKR